MDLAIEAPIPHGFGGTHVFTKTAMRSSRIALVAAALGLLAASGAGAADRTIALDTQGKNPALRRIELIVPNGARPRFAPDGRSFAFDRKNADGYYDLYVANLRGKVTASLTEGNPRLPQRNHGNGVFHPDGRWVVFLSEVEHHFADRKTYFADPGVGLFCNLWAIDVQTRRAVPLTDVPIKRSLLDRRPAIALVNPHFSPDGRTLLWTERYREGGNHGWGRWRIKAASFSIENGVPRLGREVVVFTPQRGNYVTLMGFVGVQQLLLSGNLDGQHEYGMDQYVLDRNTGRLENLTSTPLFWEEDSTVLRDGRLVYMTNRDSRTAFDFGDPNWPAQPMERDYWVMRRDGSGNQRLTYFNEPGAPEYVGHRVLAVASDANPEGTRIAATLAIDFGEERRDTQLAIAMLSLAPDAPAPR